MVEQSEDHLVSSWAAINRIEPASSHCARLALPVQSSIDSLRGVIGVLCRGRRGFTDLYNLVCTAGSANKRKDKQAGSRNSTHSYLCNCIRAPEAFMKLFRPSPSVLFFVVHQTEPILAIAIQSMASLLIRDALLIHLYAFKIYPCLCLL